MGSADRDVRSKSSMRSGMTHSYWDDIHKQVDDIDALINEFNEKSGVLASL